MAEPGLGGGSDPPAGAAPAGALLGPRIVALILVALAALLIVQALGVARGGGFSVIGPGTIPLVVAIGLLILGIAFVARTTIVPDDDLAEQAAECERATHWPTVGILGGLLIVYALVLDGFRLGPIEIPGLGYIVATALFLPAGARALGSVHLLRDVVIGLVLAVVVYFGFTEFLGVRLPPGILGPVL
jgi:putative tricarboxylic transport membrane protein